MQLLHPDGHKDNPPVYFQVCGLDPLRDEALIYEKVLRESSMESRLRSISTQAFRICSGSPLETVWRRNRKRHSMISLRWLAGSCSARN